MLDASATPIDVLEEAWKQSYVNIAEAEKYLAVIKPHLDRQFHGQNDEKHHLYLIREVVRAGIQHQIEQYENALLTLHHIIGELEVSHSLQLWQGRAYGILGIIYRQLGDRSLAIEYMLKRLKVGQVINDSTLQQRSYNVLGSLFADAQEHEQAVEYYKLCIQLARKDQEVFSLTYCFSNLAESLIQLEKFAEARSYLNEAIQLSQGDLFAFPRCVPLGALGHLETALGNFEVGLTHYKEAERLNNAHGNEYTKIRILHGLGQLYLVWKKPEQAIDYFESALTVCQQLGNRPLALPVLEKLAQTYYKVGDHQKSAEFYRALHQENNQIFQEQTEFRVRNLQIKYETEAAQKEAKLLQEQNQVLEEKVAKRTRTLAQQRDQLQNLNAQKNAFLTVLAHDMRSPLTVIGLRAELIRRNPELASQNPDYLETISEAQKTLSQMVENILDLEKLEAGQLIEINAIPFNLAEVSEEMVEQHQNLASREGVELAFSAKKQRVVVNSDHFLIQRAISNLITNAIKYTPVGGKVDVLVDKKHKHATIAVQDTGLGIEKRLLSKIFDRYYRVESHKKVAQGAGLGLSIVKAIVEAHHGEVRVQSKREEGSCFTIVLPLS
ncbi:MAG: tetratricopeptide repeat-containing sensor histidine kinase [Chloroflexota bacterium]